MYKTLLTIIFCLSFNSAIAKDVKVTVIENENEESSKNTQTENLAQQYAQSNDVIAGQWDISISLGYGKVESIIASIDDFDLYLLPSIRYYGEKFFLENTTMGYSLFENDDFYVDAVGRLNEDGIYFKLDDFGVFSALGVPPPIRDPRTPPPDPVKRKLSYLAGFAANYSLKNFDFRLGYYHDITNIHNGYEVELTLSHLFNISENWFIASSVSANHKSKKLLNYYYGIRLDEAVIEPFTYQPNSSGTNYAFSINSEYAINEQWSWQLLYKKHFLSDEIKNNDLVNKNNSDIYFFGIKYRF